jgi:hypothetical protein
MQEFFNFEKLKIFKNNIFKILKTHVQGTFFYKLPKESAKKLVGF